MSISHKLLSELSRNIATRHLMPQSVKGQITSKGIILKYSRDMIRDVHKNEISYLSNYLNEKRKTVNTLLISGKICSTKNFEKNYTKE